MMLGHDKQHRVVNYSVIRDCSWVAGEPHHAAFHPPWQGEDKVLAISLAKGELVMQPICHETNPFHHVPLSHICYSIYFWLHDEATAQLGTPEDTN